MKFDVVVIGAGSAGYAAAQAAANLGVKVAIIDKGPLGGLCILRGCMPSKAILRCSDIFSLMKRAKEFGLQTNDPKANLSAINDRKNALVREFANYRIKQLKNTCFKLIRGQAQFVSPHRVRVGTKIIQARSFIITTGSIPQRLPIPGLEEIGYITSDEALEIRKCPKSMLVLGGGAVATELGQFFCRLGVRITLIQRSEHLFSDCDKDMSHPVETCFRNEGMKVHTSTDLTRFTKKNGLITAHFLQNGKRRKASAEVVFQALGRVPNLKGLQLEKAGIETKGKRILVDDQMRTTAKHIFAAGDVVGLYEIVHIAIHQGETAGHNAVRGSRKRCIDYRLQASVIFTDPQVASVGLTEKKCKENTIDYLMAKYPFCDHGKSMVMGETHGFVKILCDPENGEILGGHIVGPEASELIHELIAIMYYRGTIHDLSKIPHYHPTLAEILTYPAEELLEQIPTLRKEK